MGASITSPGWAGVRAWLRSRDADWFLDAAVWGTLTDGDALDLLADYGLAETKANRRELRRLMDEVLAEP